MDWLYLRAANIEFRNDVLSYLFNARSPLWDESKRGLTKLMSKLGPAVGLWGDASLWLDMLRKLRVSS